MDIRNNAEIFIAKNVARTATVQILDKDAASFWVPGEIVITNTRGVALDTTTAVKAVKTICIHAKNASGNSGQNVYLKGADIVGYTHRLFKAPQPQVAVIDITDFARTDFTYQLEFTDELTCGRPQRRTISVTVGSTAETKLSLATKFVDKINEYFINQNKDRTVLSLSAAIVDTDKIAVTAENRDADGLNFEVETQQFIVDYYGYDKTAISSNPESFGATVEDNRSSAIVSPAYPVMERGVGTFELVSQNEKQARGFAQSAYNELSSSSYIVSNDYDTAVLGKFEANGTTLRRFDEITIKYKRPTSNVSGAHAQEGVIQLYLPVEDNATSQVNGVGVTTSILGVLNKYIVTEYGVGSAITLSTP